MSSDWVIPPRIVRVRVHVYDHDSDGPKYGPPVLTLQGHFCQTTLVGRVVEDLCNEWNYGQPENTWRVGRIVDWDGDPFDPRDTIWGAVGNTPVHVMKASPLYTARDILRQLESRPIVPIKAYRATGLDASPQRPWRTTEIIRAPQARTPSPQHSNSKELTKTPRGAMLGVRPQLESSPRDLVSSPTNMVAAARSAARFGRNDYIDLTINDSGSDEVNNKQPITVARGNPRLFTVSPQDRSATQLDESDGARDLCNDTPQAELWAPPVRQLSAAPYSLSPSPSKRVDIDLTWMDDSDDALPLSDTAKAGNLRGASQDPGHSTENGKYTELQVNMELEEEASKAHSPFPQTRERPSPTTTPRETRGEGWLKRSNEELDTGMGNGRGYHYSSNTTITPDTGATYSLEGLDLGPSPAPTKPRGMMLTAIRIRGKAGQGRKKQAVSNTGKNHVLASGQLAGTLERQAKRKSEEEIDVLLRTAREEAKKQSTTTKMEREKNGMMLPARSGRRSKRHRSESFRPSDEAAAVRTGPAEGDSSSAPEDIGGVCRTGRGAIAKDRPPSSVPALPESQQMDCENSAAHFERKDSLFSVSPSQADSVDGTASDGLEAISSNPNFMPARASDELKEQPQGGVHNCLLVGDPVPNQWAHENQQDHVCGDDRMQLDPPNGTVMPVMDNSQSRGERRGCAKLGACGEALDRAVEKKRRRRDRQVSARRVPGCKCLVHHK